LLILFSPVQFISKIQKTDQFTSKKTQTLISKSQTMKPKYLNLIFLFLVVTMMSCNSDSDQGFYDEQAIESLDKLTETIGALTSCSFTTHAEIIKLVDGKLIPSYRQNDIYMRGPDKMYFYVEMDDTRKGFWYDGKQLATFHFDANQHDIMDAPGTIMETIDSVHRNFKIDFPAADFFYPTLTDDIMNQFDTVVYVGTKNIEEIPCKEINATNPNLDVYILIEEATSLPKQLEIYYLGEKEGHTFVTTFSNFIQDPDLPDELFEFAPPSNSVKTSLFK